MEQTLDEIATGEAQWLPYLEKFYLGEKGLENQVKVRENQIDPSVAKAVDLENLEAIVRIGKYGPYVEAEHNGNGMVTASIPTDLTPADLDPDQVETLLRQKNRRTRKARTTPGRRANFRVGGQLWSLRAAWRSHRGE